jgi:transcriptional regulator with XRE-family HTH domain
MNRGAARLAELLAVRGQKANLSKEAGIDPSLITRWSKGEQKPKTAQRLALAERLEIDLSWWDEELVEPPPIDDPDDEATGAHEKADAPASEHTPNPSNREAS